MLATIRRSRLRAIWGIRRRGSKTGFSDTLRHRANGNAGYRVSRNLHSGKNALRTSMRLQSCGAKFLERAKKSDVKSKLFGPLEILSGERPLSRCEVEKLCAVYYIFLYFYSLA